MIKVFRAFLSGLTAPALCKANRHCRMEKQIRTDIDEKNLDKMLRDSFPASDPMSTY